MADLRLIYALILSILPISELRGGLPLAMVYANQHNISFLLILPMIIFANIIAIFLAFFFLDKIHHVLLRNRTYKRFFESYLLRIQKKTDRFESKYSAIGFLALTLFVAVPLPATGAWSGCLIAWLLDLDRKKSILAIALGVMIAGILMFFGTLGFLSIFS
ncbi:hypothetical protein A3K64_01780 [Candidatus Micrarchaeota archaeon RBG_16_36_9]|nr:MAG: hypothetical protein A3K64_01780 [Candidatus Micrarchaeota archaeon RBG_16_36_9]